MGDFSQHLGNFLMMFPIFLFALTIHEIAHALTANWGGDLTATEQNRLSLNPVVHMDLFGSVLVPVLIGLQSGFLMGWARPVPVVEGNLRDKHWNPVVSFAGPFANLLLAVGGALVSSVALVVMNFGVVSGWWTISQELGGTLARLVYMFVFLNWLLFLFNLIPVPPLDGSHLLHHFVVRGRGQLYGFWEGYQRAGFVLFIVLFISGAFGIVAMAAHRLALVTLEFARVPFHYL